MNEKLNQALKDLQDELNRLAPVYPELQPLRDKTKEALSVGEHHSVIAELKESAGKFEVRHPELTAIINNVMNTLSGMGI